MAFDAAPIASCSGGSVGGAAVTTGAMDTTGADLLVVTVGWYDGVSATVAISDSKGNAWTPGTTKAIGNASTQIWWCRPTSVGSGHTVTCGTASTFASVCATAWKVSAASPFDAENGATVNPSSTLATGSLTPTIAITNALVIASNVQRNNTGTVSIGSGFTIAVQVVGVGSNRLSNAHAYKVITSGSENPTWTAGLSDALSAAIMCFKDGTGGGPPPVTPGTMLAVF